MEHILARHRSLVALGAFLVQFALGAIYAWSVFTPNLTDPSGPYAFSASQTAWIFSTGLVTFAIVMIGAGKLLPILGPMLLTRMSALLLGMGYLFAGFYGNTYLEQLFYIGIIGGAGIGLGYVVPISVGMKWFPDKKGAITGFAVAGFGAGGALWVKLAGSWGGLLESFTIGDLTATQSVFALYGVLFFTLVFLGSFFMRYPSASRTQDHAHVQQEKAAVEFTSRDMLQTPQFYMVAAIFLFSALAGLMVIYSIKLFGIDVLSLSGFELLTASATAGSAMAWYALFNGLGRIVWGNVSDKIGPRNAVASMLVLQSLVLFTTYHVFVSYGAGAGLAIAASVIGFNFGGNFALMPVWTAKLFGAERVGSNYPWVFIAYGIAGVIGPVLAGFFKDSAAGTYDPGVWMTPFVIAALACGAGFVLTLFVRTPEHPSMRGHDEHEFSYEQR